MVEEPSLPYYLPLTELNVWDDERCGRSKDVNTPELIGQRVKVRVTMFRF